MSGKYNEHICNSQQYGISSHALLNSSRHKSHGTHLLSANQHDFDGMRRTVENALENISKL